MDKKSKHKLVALIAIAAVVAFGVVLFSKDEPKIEPVGDPIPPLASKAYQTQYKKDNGKFRFVPKQTKGNITSWVHEQQYPNGDVGYVIYYERLNPDGSIDASSLSMSRDHNSRDWHRIRNATST